MPSIPNFPDASVLIRRKPESGAGADAEQRMIFKKGEIKSLKMPKTIKQANIKIDGQTQSDAKVININLGVTKELNLDFKLLFEDIDRSDGTYSFFPDSDRNWQSSRNTFGEILDYLDYSFLDAGLGQDVKFEVEIADKHRYFKDLYTLSDFNIDVNEGIYPTGTIKLTHVKRIS